MGTTNCDGANEFQLNAVGGDERHDRPEVCGLRKQQVKKLPLFICFSNGTPIVSAGREFLQTQGGNTPVNQTTKASAWTGIGWPGGGKKHGKGYPPVIRNMIAFSHGTSVDQSFTVWRGRRACTARHLGDLSSDPNSWRSGLHDKSQTTPTGTVMNQLGRRGDQSSIQELIGLWKVAVDPQKPSPAELVMGKTH